MSGWFVGVDIGGTFTDIVAIEESSGALRHLKVPSSKADPAGAVMRGLEALDERCGVPPDGVRLIMHGTTLATNAIIERRLARTALVTTRGFRDVLEIGRHWRQELYDPFVEALPPLVPRELRFEVTERTTAAGEKLVPLDAGDVAQVLAELERADVTAVAVVLLHSYRDPAHEDALVARLRATNGWSVCGSAELSGELREYERSSTTVINAALMPLVDQYLERLEHGLAASRATPSLFITQSNGGALTPQAARARPVALAMSGPVGGVVACVELGRTIGQSNLIGLDMGGTSTDISIVSDAEPRRTSQLDVGGLPVRLPSIQVLSIGAGGGSIASVDAGGSLRVGPESAGSDPGPACYDRGGTLPTVTDCQLVLERLSEDRPLAGTLRLRGDLARAAVEQHIADPLGMTVDEAAAGVVEIANSAMEAAVRVALRDRGDDPRACALVAFGGAGPLHAVELAQRLAIRRVVVPPHPGTLSALGFLAADVRLDYAASALHRSDEPELTQAVAATFAALERRALADVQGDGQLDPSAVVFERTCDVRYTGQAYEVAVPVAGGALAAGDVAAIAARFHELHHRAYAFSSPGEQCELVTCRVAARVPLGAPATDGGAGTTTPAAAVAHGPGGHDRADLSPTSTVDGPAVIHQDDATTYLPAGTRATVDAHGNLVVDLEPRAE